MTVDHHGRTAGRATLLVRAVDEILGTHSRWIIYVAAAPAGESAVGIDGTEELAEVRWVGWRKPIS